MYEVIIFEHKGESTVKSRIMELEKQSKTNKHARVLFKKILEYITILKKNGTRAGEKYTKHIEGDIWELRPLGGQNIFLFLGKQKNCTAALLSAKIPKNSEKGNRTG